MKQKAIGKGIMIIAIVILIISTLCRLADAEKSKGHIHVTGTVSKIQEKTESVRAGKRYVNSSSYTVWINFRPVGWLSEDGIVENHVYDYFSVGDTVAILYPEDAVYEAYSAKKDWLTGAYLPIEGKIYDLSLVIAAILFVAGAVLYKKFFGLS